MNFTPLPVTAHIAEYESQAGSLLEAWRNGEPAALEYFLKSLPRLLDDKFCWVPKPLSEEAIRAEVFSLEDARMAVARGYDFFDWNALASFTAAMEVQDPEIQPFECAIEAVVNGDLETLQSLLDQQPKLVHARSRRVTHFEPSIHGATLLHYVAANGTECYRQRTPANAVAIATALLDRGAAVDALASLYGGEWTTMSLLVSSSHPAAAGVQIELIDLLVSRGASIHELGKGHWGSPLETALVFGFAEAAEALLRHGAPLSFVAASGLGRVDEVSLLLPAADSRSRHYAFALATQLGQLEVTRILLDAGEDPNRFNPEGTHSHTPPIHQAILSGHLEVVQLLVERGARLDVRDKIYHSTPLGWAEHAGKAEIAQYLRDFEPGPIQK